MHVAEAVGSPREQLTTLLARFSSLHARVSAIDEPRCAHRERVLRARKLKDERSALGGRVAEGAVAAPLVSALGSLVKEPESDTLQEVVSRVLMPKRRSVVHASVSKLIRRLEQLRKLTEGDSPVLRFAPATGVPRAPTLAFTAPSKARVDSPTVTQPGLMAR